MEKFDEVLREAIALGERAKAITSRYTELKARVSGLTEKLNEATDQFESLRNSLHLQAAAEARVIAELRQSAINAMDAMDGRIQDGGQSVGDWILDATDDIQERYEEFGAQLADLHENAMDELQDQLTEGMEESSEIIEAAVDRIRGACGEFDEDAERVAGRLQSVQEKIEKAGSEVGRVLDAVGEAQAMASSGLRSAAQALRSVQSVMDEIF